MKHPIHRHLLATFGAVTIAVILLPLLTAIGIAMFIASLPSRIGKQAPVDGWVKKILNRVVDIELMIQFRDDIIHRIRPHIAFDESLDRWWIIHEMGASIDRTNRSLQSGEYTIVILLTISSIYIDASLYSVPVSVLLTVIALALSWLVLVRVILIDVLAFRPEIHMNKPTHDLAVMMAFNRGPLFTGASFGLAILSLFIGLTNGRGYELGLDLVERLAASTHPEDANRWWVNE